MATTTRSRVSEGIDGKDAVGLYLEGIAKTPLLTAEEEVELAKTIEIGLYAEHVLSGDVTLAERGKHAKRPSKAELEFLVDEGRRAMQHFVTANLTFGGFCCSQVRPVSDAPFGSGPRR